MKKHLLTKLFVLLGVLLAGTSAWGQTSVTLWEEDWSGTSANQTPATCTMNGYSDITYTYTNGGTTTRTLAKSSFTDPELLISKGSGKFSATIPASKLSGVETTLSLTFSCNRNLTVNVTNGTLGSNTGSGNTYTYAVTVTSTSSDLVLEFVNGTSSNARFSNISLTGTSTGGGTLTPVISASDPATLAYDATGGTINYTITNGTGNVSAVSSETWLTIGTITGSEVPFTVTQNDGSADRTATVTLSYTGATDKIVTVTQGHLFTPADGVFDFTTGEAYGSGVTPSTTQLSTAATFTAGNITLTTSGNFAYYSSTPPALRVYKNSSFTLEAPSGYVITGVSFTGTQNLDKVTADDGTYTASSGTAATWSGSQQSVTFTQDGTASANPWYETITVTYSAASASTKLYIKADYAPWVWAWDNNQNYTGGTWPGVNATTTEEKYGVTWYTIDLATNDPFNLILHNNMGGDANQTPTIALTGETYLFTNCATPALGANQYMIVDPTATPVSANNVAVEVGSTVNADVTNTNSLTLTYTSGDTSVATVDASTGVATGVAAGTATITVSWAMQGTTNGTGFLAGSITYDVTVTAPVVDYATLPFTFTGGKADIANTNGLTEYSLGNDYSSTLANLGFRATGQALVLHFNSEPGVLTFNIRGNSFSGGTFKLQESADGLTYTDVKTWTSFTGTTGDGQEETISNLQSTSRYIQWVYTEKSSGNVGVGNINLAVPVVSQYTVTPASNNTSYGTVAIANNVITATPAEHYRVSTTTPYEVSPSGAATVTDNGNGTFTVSNLTDDCTVTINFEAIPTYEVTITAPTNGTLVVKNAGTAIASGDMIEEGTELDIEATPAAGYNFQNWQANDGSVHTYTTNFKWTVNAAVTISANFVAKEYHNANFYVNGVKTSVEYETGESITFPADPADINGKTFRGWYDDHYTSADTAPVYVVTGTQTMGSSDLNFYAVFATVTGGGGSDVDDVLDNANTIGATQTGYTTWTTSGLNADYAGQSAGSSGTIQLRSNNNNSGIVSTTSAGKIKKVTVTWSTAAGISISDGRTVDIYGKNSAYDAPTDLYSSSTQGTLLGSVVYHTSGNGTSTTEVTVSGDYEYVGIRSRSGAAYFDDITITWTSGTSGSESGYCTEIPVDYTMNSVGTGTYVLQNDIDAYLTYSENGGEMHIYKVDAFTNEEVSMVELGQDEDGDNGSERYIPAGTPVIIVGDADTDYSLVVAGAAAQVVSDNILNAGTDAYPSGVGPFYVLQKPAGTTDAKFYKLSANRVVPTTSAYLDATDMVQSLPAPSPAGRKIMGIDGGDLTGIDGINNDANENVFADGKWYNLQGIEVKNPSKGIYLHNGKKVVVK